MTEVEAEAGNQKLLFNLWDMSEVEIQDQSLIRYVNLHAMIVPHSCGKLAGQQFNKSNMLIVERLINKLMQTERNTGKKELAIRIVRDAFEIIHKRPGRTRPGAGGCRREYRSREETVRLKCGGSMSPISRYRSPAPCRYRSAVHHRWRPAGEP